MTKPKTELIVAPKNQQIVGELAIPAEDAGVDAWTAYIRYQVNEAETVGKRATVIANEAGRGLYHVWKWFITGRRRSSSKARS